MKSFLKLICVTILFSFVMILAGARSPQWEKVRKDHLKIEPVCQLCGSSKDLQVHHKKPYHLYPELELVQSNLVTVCTSKAWGFNCHSTIAHGGNFKWENPWVVEDIAKMKVIASPAYIKAHGTKERDDYIIFVHNRVKVFNVNKIPIPAGN